MEAARAIPTTPMPKTVRDAIVPMREWHLASDKETPEENADA